MKVWLKQVWAVTWFAWPYVVMAWVASGLSNPWNIVVWAVFGTLFTLSVILKIMSIRLKREIARLKAEIQLKRQAYLNELSGKNRKDVM